MRLPKILRCGSCGSGPKLLSMLAMTGSFMLVELIVGNMTNSMALVADSFHMLSDVIALIIAYVSVKMSPKKWRKNTYGWARAEVVGALVNAVFLIALCFSISVEAIKRFLVIEHIEDPQLIMIVGGVGLAINLVGMLLFGDVGHGHSHGGGGHGHSHGGEKKELENGGGHGHSHDVGHGHSHDGEHGHSHGEDKAKQTCHEHEKNDGDDGEKDREADSMNITGVFLHVMADALGSVVVLISASVIWLTDWQYKDYLDPVLSLFIVVIICATTWPLLRDSTLVLLNTIPPNIDLVDLQSKLVKTVKGVSSIHELHVWRLVGRRVVASCHLEMTTPEKGTEPVDHHMEVAREVKEFFHRAGIHSTTIQLEYGTLMQSNNNGSCRLLCPKKSLSSGELSSDCLESSCCRERPARVSGKLNGVTVVDDMDVMTKL